MRSGKLVHSDGITYGKSGVWLFPITQTFDALVMKGSVKPNIIPHFAPFFTQYLSPLKVAVSPLSEHYFYPVSTGPINTPIKRKLKKGSK